ncbi:MAG: PilZ domain-containing protein [Desulfobacterales bacterium]|jgi:c-di-GMP-binding flagellar brake protein YcgR|nr:PilZ domain-containing protein [Desulfobacterales bacterium]
MSTPERRKQPRVKINYPISYVCTDKKGCIVQQNMGVALNISQSGILIETADSVFSKYVTLISVDLKENIIEIKGKVAYCKKNKAKKYRVGISFEGTHAQNIRFVKTLIRSYYYNKDEYRYSSSSERKTAVM